jgi:uncharacterized cupin superfamily protein
MPSARTEILGHSGVPNTTPPNASQAVFRSHLNVGAKMPKPFVNLDELEFGETDEHGFYVSRRAKFSAAIGARKLGYSVTELPPGKAQCPFHSHRAEEEMFLILEGEGQLRYGSETYPIRKHDVIACPTGGASTAHQIINTGSAVMRYLALSNLSDLEICEYPDSNKTGVYAEAADTPGLRQIFHAESTVEYHDRELMEPPKMGD